MPDITHLIYDFDGLLLDTEPIHVQVNSAIATRYGQPFPASVHAKIIGRTALDSAQLIVELLDLPLTAHDYLEQRNALIHDLYATAQPMPGAVELTQRLKRQGMPQAIATSSASPQFGLKTLHHQPWLQIFDCIVLGDDPEIRQDKPAPDSFLVTAARLGADPAHCLVFEDSLAGVTAAKAAGMSVIAIPEPTIDPGLFQAADEILPALTAFNPAAWGLPPMVPEAHTMSPG